VGREARDEVDDMQDDAWGLVRQELREAVGPHNFKHWIEPLRLLRRDGGVATFEAPTGFVGDWVANNFGEEIRRRLEGAGAPVQRLAFEVAREGPREAASPEAAGGKAQPPRAGARPSEALGAPIDPRCTFDSFVVGRPNALAAAAARRVAEGQVSYNPLCLYGGVGRGKTHLMHAVAWDLAARRPGLEVVYLSAEQFMFRFVQALRERRMMDFKELFRSVDVLLVDDIQFIAGKDSTQEEFFHTFNALVDAGKQVVIAADRPPAEIPRLEERIASRLQCGLMVDLQAADHDLRLRVLQQRLEARRSEYPEAEVEGSVLDMLARRVTANLRVLEGALTRLLAFASLTGRAMTPDLAQECLSDVLRASDRRLDLDAIQTRVAEHYGLSVADLVGPGRARAVARPRQMAMYLSKTLTERSLPEIGRSLGGRDHTTVMHGVRRIEALRGTDDRIARDLEALRRALQV
jgi:chromosomal replication initiator protein